MGTEEVQVGRSFAIERETIPGGANADQPFRLRQPARRLHIMRAAIARSLSPGCRTQRVMKEQVLQIRQQQFLMLLFVVQPKRKQLRTALSDNVHRLQQRLVHPKPVVDDFGKRRSRQQATLRPGMAWALGLIIAVEQVGPAWVLQPITGHVITQQEGLEKPAGMREVPFGWGGVRHGLGGCIRFRKSAHQIQAQSPHGQELCTEFFCAAGRRFRGHAIHPPCHPSVQRGHRLRKLS